MGRRKQTDRVNSALTRRNPVRWLMATGVLLLLAIMLAATTTIIGSRDSTLQTHRQELENRLVLLTRHYEQEFGDLERVQRDITANLQLVGVASPEQFNRHMKSHDEHLRLKAKLNNKVSSTLNILDADGWMINTTQAWPVKPFNFANRDYFQELRERTSNADLEVAELVRSPIDGRQRLLFARRLNGPNGEFLGVATRHVSPEQFQAFFSATAPSKHSTIAMWSDTFVLVARYPQADNLIGEKFKPDAVLARMTSSDAPSTVVSASTVDGRERMSSIQRIPGFPLAMVASTPLEEVLADWAELARIIVIAALLAALLVVAGLYLVVRQVRQQNRLSRAQLKLEKERLNTAINNLSQGLVLYDADARAVVVSRTYLSMYRMSADVIKPGCTLHDVITQHKASGCFEGDVEAYCSRVLEAIKTRQSVIHNIPDGRVIQVQSLPIADGGWVVTHEDITERHRVEERISHLAHYDYLTDLPNRVLFRELLANELAWIARGQNCAVLYIDMDEFKAINDSLGHSVGDALLRAVAQRLKACVRVRSGDVVARLGGDEFAIVQIDVKSRGEIIDLVDRIFTAIRAPFECLGHSLFTDASIGIAMAPQDGEDLDTLLKNADLAMYSAKAEGRRTHRFFEPDMDARVQAQRLLEHDLRHASADGGFEAGGFEVYYQPLLRLDDDTVSGCEALLRWRHPVRGIISPVEFIPAAESIGVINQLGEWVLRTACAEAAIWPGDIKIAVNVSPVQFRSPTLGLKVAAALASSGLPPQRLELEITEAVLIRDDDAALAILHQLRDLGVRIALDDFGTGYSSLSYLQRFPFDKIKIDRCFVTDIAEPDGSSAIVQAVVNIAAARHMTTTAEGVETERQKEILRTLGCMEMQGWLFSAARPATEVRALIAAHRAKVLAA